MKYFTEYASAIAADAKKLTTGNVAHHRASIVGAAEKLVHRLSYDHERIYISGRVSHLVHKTVCEKFNAAERMILKLYPGADIFNPIREVPENSTWIEAMRICKMAVPTCGKILMLSDYKDSPGALIELADANQLGLEVIYETDLIQSDPTANNEDSEDAHGQLSNILAIISDVVGIDESLIISSKRNDELCNARIVCFALCQKYTLIHIRHSMRFMNRGRALAYHYMKKMSNPHEVQLHKLYEVCENRFLESKTV